MSTDNVGGITGIPSPEPRQHTDSVAISAAKEVADTAHEPLDFNTSFANLPLDQQQKLVKFVQNQEEKILADKYSDATVLEPRPMTEEEEDEILGLHPMTDEEKVAYLHQSEIEMKQKITGAKLAEALNKQGATPEDLQTDLNPPVLFTIPSDQVFKKEKSLGEHHDLIQTHIAAIADELAKRIKRIQPSLLEKITFTALTALVIYGFIVLVGSDINLMGKVGLGVTVGVSYAIGISFFIYFLRKTHTLNQELALLQKLKDQSTSSELGVDTEFNVVAEGQATWIAEKLKAMSSAEKSKIKGFDEIAETLLSDEIKKEDLPVEFQQKLTSQEHLSNEEMQERKIVIGKAIDAKIDPERIARIKQFSEFLEQNKKAIDEVATCIVRAIVNSL